MSSHYRTSKVELVRSNKGNSTSIRAPSIRIQLQLITLRITGKIKGKGEMRVIITMVKRDHVPVTVTIVGLRDIGQGNVVKGLQRKAVQVQDRNALGPNAMIRTLAEDRRSVD